LDLQIWSIELWLNLQIDQVEMGNVTTYKRYGCLIEKNYPCIIFRGDHLEPKTLQKLSILNFQILNIRSMIGGSITYFIHFKWNKLK
jgi:hypothetical protein